MEEVLPHIAKRVLLLILLWILPFFIADLFIDKNYFCATGDMFAIFFWQGVFNILFGLYLSVEAYRLYKKKKRGCMIANIVMTLPTLFFISVFIGIFVFRI